MIQLMVLFAVFGVSAAEEYVIFPGGAVDGCKAYTDRDYVYQKIPAALQGADLCALRVFALKFGCGMAAFRRNSIPFQ